jgi:hypothetical protein
MTMETSTSTSTGSSRTAGARANGVKVRASSKRPSRARTPQARKPRVAHATPKAAHVAEATVTVRTKSNGRGMRMDARTLVLASIGAGELAVSTARTASEKVVEMTRNPMGMQAVADAFATDVTRVIGDLAIRGEKLVSGIQDSAYTKRAMGQTKIARSQVKAAGTSIRKAVDTATVAAREAVKKVS